MAAEHVAQQCAQVLGELVHELVDIAAARREARDRAAFERDRMRDALGERGAVGRPRAPRREARREASAAGPSGLEQRAQREQMVAQRDERVVLLAAELEATQRPADDAL